MGLFYHTVEEIISHLEEFLQELKDEEVIDICIEIILNARKIFIYGAGRSGMVGKMCTQRLMHLSLPSYFLSETLTPRFTPNDCLIVISGSGETLTPVSISKGAKEIGGKIIALTANPHSTIGQIADHVILVKGQTKDAKQEALAPFTSLFDITALVVLDSMTRSIMNRIGKTEDDIHQTHASLE
ncbi:MAG: 6-phospho-3-hexuloisomerase [Promethearchaeota archaeon]